MYLSTRAIRSMLLVSLAFGLLLLIGCPAPPVSDNCGGECKETEECVENQFCLPKCKEGESRCGSKCIDLKVDAAHCGACDAKCKEGEGCKDGKCGEAASCKDGQTDCSGTCVDTKTSDEHCGGCGTTCKEGEGCKDGSCEAASACTSGQTDCSGTCVDTNTSSEHCGKCDNACSGEQTCDAGACTCPSGKTSCGGGCVDTDSSDEHCGKCGNKCNSPQYCDVGQCACPSEQTSCGGSCVNTKSDPAHCGGCGTQCPSGETCSDGRCGGSCAAPKTDCSGSCVDTSSDTSHCGSCGNACQSGETCDSGACTIPCAAPKKICSGACVDTSSDATNCGSCGNMCSPGSSCDSGACKAGCPAPKKVCNGTCTDTDADAKHCGSCGKACASGQNCTSGVCVTPCAAPKKVCNGACVDVQSNDKHCGSCGNLCKPTETCVAGKCELPCASPKKVCNGACIDVTYNEQNCGDCSKSCAAGEVCRKGSCQGSWARVVTGGGTTHIKSIAANAKGNAYVTGTTNTSSGTPRLLLYRFDASGTSTALNQTAHYPWLFIADLSQDVAVKSKANQMVDITPWRASGLKGLTNRSNAMSSNGIVTVPYDGYYYFSARISFNNAQNGVGNRYIAIALSINNSTTPYHGAYIQTFNSGMPAESLVADGLFKLKKGDTARVKVISGKDNDYIITTRSGFSGMYLGKDLSDGFQATLAASISLAASTSATVKPLKNPGRGAAFTTKSLNLTTGEYTAPADGAYYFSAKVVFVSSTSNAETIAQLVINGSTGYAGRSAIMGPMSQARHANFFSTVVQLKKGDKVRLDARSSKTGISLNGLTTFSGYRLPYMPHGFSASRLSDQAISGTGWKKVILDKVAGKPGLWNGGAHYNASTGEFTAPASGTYNFQAQVIFKALSGGIVRVVLAVNGDRSLERGTHVSYRGGTRGAARFTAFTGGFLSLSSGDKVSLWVSSDVDSSYSIAGSSGFSGYVVSSNQTLEGRAVATDDNDNAYVTGLFRGTLEIGSVHQEYNPRNRSFISSRKADGTWAPSQLLSLSNPHTIHSDRGGQKLTVCGDIAETWTYASGKSIQATPAGGLDGYVARVTPGGAVQWAFPIQTSADPRSNHIRCSTTTTGATYAIGRFASKAQIGSVSLAGSGSNSKFHYYLTRVKADGSGVDWAQEFKLGATVSGVATDSQENVYVAGTYKGDLYLGSNKLLTSTTKELFVVALDKTGKVLWSRNSKLNSGDVRNTRIAVGPRDIPHLVADFSGTLTLDTTSLQTKGKYDILVAALDAKGSWLWAKSIGGTEDEVEPWVTLGPNGDLFVSGLFKSSTFKVGSHMLTKSQANSSSYDSFLLRNLP